MARDEKVFTDILEEYPKLQFIFEYGFRWDAEITKLLWKKGEDTFWDVHNMISGWEKMPVVTWREGADTREICSRNLFKRNHYRIQKSQWVPFVYGSYGARYDWGERYDKNFWEKKAKENPIGQQFCAVPSEKESKRNEWTLERMTAGWDDLWPEWKPSERQKEKEKEYEKFLLMLAFFAEFTPLSVLGYNFLRRLGREIGLTNPYIFVRRPFLHDALEQESIFRCLYAMMTSGKLKINNVLYHPVQLLYMDKAFEINQSNLYLKAVRAGRKPEESRNDCIGKSPEKKWVIEVKFYYLKFKNLTGYLVERREKSVWENNKIREGREEIEEFSSPYYKETEWSAKCIVYEIPEQDKETFCIFIQSFGDFACILNESRKKEEIAVLDTDSIVSSEAETEYLLLSGGIQIEQKNAGFQNKGKKRFFEIAHGLEECSLCNAYNSNYLFAKRTVLPPTKSEIAWLKFVLEEYPNFSRMFLREDTRRRILKQISEQYQSLPALFDREKYDWSPRKYDLKSSDTGAKYGRILDTIREKVILEYEDNKTKREVRILPYALEYNVMKHSLNPPKEPMTILCYDLEQKRDVIVSISRIRVKERTLYKKETRVENGIETTVTAEVRKGRIARSAYHFSLPDKIYHLLSYAVRCAMEGTRSLKPDYEQYIEWMLPQENRNEITAYERKIKKKIYPNGAVKNCDTEIRTDQDFANLEIRPDIDETIRKQVNIEHLVQMNRDVFAYYEHADQNASIAEKERNYYKWMHRFFVDAVTFLFSGKQSKKRTKNAITSLWNLPDDVIWDLIDGEEKTWEYNEGQKVLRYSIPNEIVYYDEVLKCEELSFLIKREYESDEETLKKVIRDIYEVFSGYVCTGYYDKKKRLRFSVSYERFYYRDIHMRCMTLCSWIDFDSITPEKEKQQLCQRIKNKKYIP